MSSFVLDIIFNLSENSLHYHSTWDFNWVAKNNCLSVCKVQCCVFFLKIILRILQIILSWFSSHDWCFLPLNSTTTLQTLQWHLALSHKVELKSNCAKPQRLFWKTFCSQPVRITPVLPLLCTSIFGSLNFRDTALPIYVAEGGCLGHCCLFMVSNESTLSDLWALTSIKPFPWTAATPWVVSTLWD